MSDTSETTSSKTPRVVIAFRHSKNIKGRLDGIAATQNLDSASIYRNVFNAGLKHLYGFEIVGNELIDSPTAD